MSVTQSFGESQRAIDAISRDDSRHKLPIDRRAAPRFGRSNSARKREREDSSPRATRYNICTRSQVYLPLPAIPRREGGFILQREGESYSFMTAIVVDVRSIVLQRKCSSLPRRLFLDTIFHDRAIIGVIAETKVRL